MTSIAWVHILFISLQWLISICPQLVSQSIGYYIHKKGDAATKPPMNSVKCPVDFDSALMGGREGRRSRLWYYNYQREGENDYSLPSVSLK
jgi:hypothetical protein